MQYESNRAALESGEGMKAIEVSVALSAVLFTSFCAMAAKVSGHFGEKYQIASAR